MENPALSELASRWQFDGDEYQIRFDLLAKYLVENGNSFDSHFKSQYESCRLCTIKYDYIIKLETLHEGKIFKNLETAPVRRTESVRPIPGATMR